MSDEKPQSACDRICFDKARAIPEDDQEYPDPSTRCNRTRQRLPVAICESRVGGLHTGLGAWNVITANQDLGVSFGNMNRSPLVIRSWKDSSWTLKWSARGNVSIPTTLRLGDINQYNVVFYNPVHLHSTLAICRPPPTRRNRQRKDLFVCQKLVDHYYVTQRGSRRPAIGTDRPLTDIRIELSNDRISTHVRPEDGPGVRGPRLFARRLRVMRRGVINQSHRKG